MICNWLKKTGYTEVGHLNEEYKHIFYKNERKNRQIYLTGRLCGPLAGGGCDTIP